jgi:hypothetical protein
MIVEHIRAADCVIVCWSLSSLRDEPVLSDARIAKELGKLIPVLINPLMPDHFPKDLRPADAANLATWNGDYDDEKWRDFRNRVVSKIAEVEAKQGKAVSSPGRRIYSTKTELDEATAAKNVDDGKKQGKKVFICYRRDDSAGSAGRVKDRLEKEFGSDLLFMDVDAILYGG